MADVMDGFVTVRFPALVAPKKQEADADPPELVEKPGVESDESLLARIQTGDQDALALLFRRHAGAVRRVAYRVLRDSSEADDMLQEVFLLVHRNSARFDPAKGPARFWILQIAYRRAISRRRYLDSRHFYTRLDLDEAGVEGVAPTYQAGLHNKIDEVLGAGVLDEKFRNLSENQQRTLRMFFVEGYRLDEIAAKLGQSRENVRHHYFRGLEKLRKQIFGGSSRTK
jgi:RNA polymerase sigma-70 factor, ECF subfamily